MIRFTATCSKPFRGSVYDTTRSISGGRPCCSRYCVRRRETRTRARRRAPRHRAGHFVLAPKSSRIWWASSIDGLRSVPRGRRRLEQSIRNLRRCGCGRADLSDLWIQAGAAPRIAGRAGQRRFDHPAAPGTISAAINRGCLNAIAESAPVRLSGVVVDYGQIELYRAAFMPLAMPENSSMQLVFGTFNRLIGPQAHSSGSVPSLPAPCGRQSDHFLRAASAGFPWPSARSAHRVGRICLRPRSALAYGPPGAVQKAAFVNRREIVNSGPGA